MNKLYLVSTSPRRISILKKFGYDFEVLKPEEVKEVHTSPEDTLLNASRKLEGFRVREGQILLAADTLVFCDGKTLGKPSSMEEAKEYLRILSGKTHRVYTGYVLRSIDKKIERIVETEVTFFELGETELEFILKFDNPLDKAGAYGIQDFTGIFVKSIKGSYYNVVGLPIEYLYFDLKKMGLLPTP